MPRKTGYPQLALHAEDSNDGGVLSRLRSSFEGLPVSRRAVTIMIALAVSGCATAPEAPSAGDPKEGYAVAQALCASCHSIEASGASPNPGAPPLRYALANLAPDALVRDFEQAVSISHMRMPTFHFGERHPADLVAYLQEIQQPPPPAN